MLTSSVGLIIILLILVLSVLCVSVQGLNFDFVAYNLLGHFCYGVFNAGLYWSTSVQVIHSGFYAPQLYRQVLLRRVLAMGILSVCLSVTAQCRNNRVT